MKIVFCGHWHEVPEGWVSIPENEQDITKPLPYSENSVNQIFTEHGWEHLPFEGAVCFAREAHRVLEKGGIIRTVCPTINQLCAFKVDSDLSKEYIRCQTSHYYPNEFSLLEGMGIDPIAHGKQFMLDSLFKGHHHKMIWSAELIAEVLEKIGFSEVNITVPGDSKWDKSTCLERIVRGIEPDRFPEITHYDPESQVIEAKK